VSTFQEEGAGVVVVIRVYKSQKVETKRHDDDDSTAKGIHTTLSQSKIVDEEGKLTKETTCLVG